MNRARSTASLSVTAANVPCAPRVSTTIATPRVSNVSTILETCDSGGGDVDGDGMVTILLMVRVMDSRDVVVVVVMVVVGDRISGGCGCGGGGGW